MTFLGPVRAGRAPRRREAPDTTPARLDVNAEVAAVRRELAQLDARVARLVGELGRPGTAGALAAVDGPFVGDAPAAVETAVLWLGRSRGRLDEARASLAEAHVAAGGLASRW